MELAFFQDEEAAANSNENCLEDPERECRIVVRFFVSKLLDYICSPRWREVLSFGEGVLSKE